MSDPKSAYAHPEVLVSTEWLAEHLKEPGTRIVESNEDVLLYDTGHIPGAVSAPTTANVGADGRFLPAAGLRARFATLLAAGDDGLVGVYCGSGITAAHEVLALELAGIRASLYVGSWSNWVADPARPVATGPERG